MQTSNDMAPPCPLKAPVQATATAGDAAPDVAAVNCAYVEAPAGARRISLWLLRLVGQARRQYLSRLRPGYVERARAERQGACRRCGACCDLTFHCPFYDAARGCRIYEKRTRTCRDFPIDAADLRLTKVPCGHHYEKPLEGGGCANPPG